MQVKIFTNGLYETVPTPLKKDVVNDVEKTYDTGYFISYRYVKLPISFLKDGNNYN